MVRMVEPIILTECQKYVEDPFVCYGDGDPKGQCQNCGAKWFEHRVEALPEEDRESALGVQAYRGISNGPKR
jgi:hypothetical protein